jgi:hypothetical protein
MLSERSQTQKAIDYDSTYVKCPGETESRLVVARLRIKGKGIDQDFF